MRFVPIKTAEQQDILFIHRVRQRLVKNRTALANEIRGLLHEFGFVIPQGINKIMTKLTEILDEGALSQLSYRTFSELKEEFLENDKKIKELGCIVTRFEPTLVKPLNKDPPCMILYF